ncbi:hypothetical protein GUITHDRAFT_103616 [Guillardia theta CCMP2712]|uniref:Uncharacterized protein n=1 Tax=Guillardia theta (strain CCMP2712) TaxID=905079 RepID=L1JQM6_GUITC|nr:hypothetical protein GUITHDRAFT_103616 [Guillardia theta CCMP2712]EKX50383.1 hypothetical protein GUITHDRAFT_103616 [Guillardia theta CCMP2712]|eukprot:XP_005837363.1 hypothetical protein GUITHDRAFT_103616 [Guillardia theta CCMP2712]
MSLVSPLGILWLSSIIISSSEGLCCFQWTRFDREQSAVCQRSCLRIRGGNDGGDEKNASVQEEDPHMLNVWDIAIDAADKNGKKLRDQFAKAVMQGSSNILEHLTKQDEGTEGVQSEIEGEQRERKNEEIGDVQQDIKVVQGKIEGVQGKIEGVQQEITDVLRRMQDQNDQMLKEVHMQLVQQLVAYQQQLVEDKKQLVEDKKQLVAYQQHLIDREKLLLDKDKLVEGLIPHPVQLRDSMSRPEGETELNVAIMGTNRTYASWHAKFLERALDYRMRRKGFTG